jgi:hypothetical protein
MALVNKAGFLRYQSQRLIGSSHESLCPIKSSEQDVTLRSDPCCVLEAAAEVVGAETGHRGQISHGQSIIEMRLDIVTNPP